MALKKKLSPMKKKSLAKDILEKNGYKNLIFLGQGSFGVTYKCKNKEGDLVAAKVTFGDIDNIALKQEVKAAKELKSMKKIDWTKYKMFLSEEEFKEKQEASENYKKYINKPVCVSSTQEGDCEIAIFESPLAEGDLKGVGIERNDLNKIKQIGRDVLKGLIIIHDQDRLHLDIKPENILKLKSDKGNDVFQLADFGTLKPAIDGNEINEEVVNDETKYKVNYNTLSALAGSSNYKPPEVIQMKACTLKELKSIDIYALGLTLLDLYLDNVNKDNDMLDEIYDLCTKDIQQLKSLKYLSDEEKNFLENVGKMCSENSSDRPTAKQALQLLS